MNDGKKSKPKPEPEAVNSGEKQGPDKDPKTGQFLPGNRLGKGNPNLRRIKEMREALQEAATPERLQAVLTVMLRKAIEEGDVQAGRLALEYAVGKPKRQDGTEAVEIDLPKVESAENLAAAGGKVLEALAAGEIDLAQARGIGEILGTAGKLFELSEVERRLRALEGGDEVEPDRRYL